VVSTWSPSSARHRLTLPDSATRAGLRRGRRYLRRSRESNLGPVASESSFDIVSKINRQEVDNALNQAAKEIGTRFDFRGVGASIAWSGSQAVEIRANSEERANAVLDVFKDKLVRRSVSLKVLDTSEPRASGKEYRLAVGLKEGISQDDSRKISKIIRDEGPKGVRAQVQGDELRVSAKKKDDLQQVISLLKGKEFDLALQFVNYR
jgi:cyclic-di-GMP-binding protein